MKKAVPDAIDQHGGPESAKRILDSLTRRYSASLRKSQPLSLIPTTLA